MVANLEKIFRLRKYIIDFPITYRGYLANNGIRTHAWDKSVKYIPI